MKIWNGTREGADMEDKSCEYGRSLEPRITALEAKCKDMAREAKETRMEILAKLESWWPKPLAILLSGLFLIIGAMITAIAMLMAG